MFSSPKPYVSVTGVTTKEEVANVIQAFQEAQYTLSSPHIPMLGYLVSQNTLNGGIENRRYPRVVALRELLEVANGKVATMIHYHTKEPGSLVEQIEKVCEGIYPELCKAVQINVHWPSGDVIRSIKMNLSSLEVVLPITHTIMYQESHKDMGSRLARYGSAVDYVLIDPSGGKGIVTDNATAVALYNVVKSGLPKATVGFAGGFDGDNVKERVKDLRTRIGNTDFSIDGEGRLRDKITEAYGDDTLNLDKVKKYINAAALVLP